MRKKYIVEPNVVQLRKIYWIVGERDGLNHLLVDLQCNSSLCLLQFGEKIQFLALPYSLEDYLKKTPQII